MSAPVFFALLVLLPSRCFLDINFAKESLCVFSVADAQLRMHLHLHAWLVPQARLMRVHRRFDAMSQLDRCVTVQVLLSDVALAVVTGALWRAGQASGWWWLMCTYGIPYLVVNHWLVRWCRICSTLLCAAVCCSHPDVHTRVCSCLYRLTL